MASPLPRHLAASLAQLYNKPLLYQQSARHAHRTATQQPGWRTVARRLHRVLQDMEARRRPAPQLQQQATPMSHLALADHN